jgi:exoribonuclease II
MENSGIEEILNIFFGKVAKMVSGKKFPHNVCALRMLTEEILCGIFNKNALLSYQDLRIALETISERSKTAKLFVNMLIKSMLIIMKFVRARRESDFLLHHEAFKEMTPYFFETGHVNYRAMVCVI